MAKIFSNLSVNKNEAELLSLTRALTSFGENGDYYILKKKQGSVF